MIPMHKTCDYMAHRSDEQCDCTSIAIAYYVHYDASGTHVQIEYSCLENMHHDTYVSYQISEKIEEEFPIDDILQSFGLTEIYIPF